MITSNFSNDEEHLLTFEKKLQLIRDRVQSVVGRYHTGCYLVGRPGTSKTYTIKQTLNQCEVPWTYLNARMTPMGLFSILSENPEHIFVLDDISALFKSEQALQILLAALDGDPAEPRLINYKSKDKSESVWFTGAIIAISNIPLRCDPLARALGSRLVTVEHEPSDEEMSAYILQLAEKGFDGLTPDECLQVAKFLILETRNSDIRLDFRHYDKAVRDYKQFKDGKAKTCWRDLIRTSLTKPATETLTPMSKKEEMELEKEKLREAMCKYPDSLKEQMKVTGLKRATFYKRRKEVLAEDA